MMNEIRMRELAEKFASELEQRLDRAELVELVNELDLSWEEVVYFGWVDDDDVEEYV